jgi:acetoacetyl-CoA synthetase
MLFSADGYYYNGKRFESLGIKKDICLSSISGGTDLNGCFALENPIGARF